MYISIGSNKHVLKKSIIGIFDIDDAQNSKELIVYLQKKEKEKKIINAAKEIPRSFVIIEENGEEIIYLSQFAVATLKNKLS